MRASSFLGLTLSLTSVISSSPIRQQYTINENTICLLLDGGEKCYPKIFTPGDQWQEIFPGQEIPGGK